VEVAPPSRRRSNAGLCAGAIIHSSTGRWAWAPRRAMARRVSRALRLSPPAQRQPAPSSLRSTSQPAPSAARAPPCPPRRPSAPLDRRSPVGWRPRYSPRRLGQATSRRVGSGGAQAGGGAGWGSCSAGWGGRASPSRRVSGRPGADRPGWPARTPSRPATTPGPLRSREIEGQATLLKNCNCISNSYYEASRARSTPGARPSALLVSRAPAASGPDIRGRDVLTI